MTKPFSNGTRSTRPWSKRPPATAPGAGPRRRLLWTRSLESEQREGPGATLVTHGTSPRRRRSSLEKVERTAPGPSRPKFRTEDKPDVSQIVRSSGRRGTRQAAVAGRRAEPCRASRTGPQPVAHPPGGASGTPDDLSNKYQTLSSSTGTIDRAPSRSPDSARARRSLVGSRSQPPAPTCVRRPLLLNQRRSEHALPDRLIGRTAGSDPASRGSSPCPATKSSRRRAARSRRFFRGVGGKSAKRASSGECEEGPRRGTSLVRRLKT